MPDETKPQIREVPAYPAVDTEVIGIDGMTCDHCVRKVDQALRGVRGVKDVQVDRANARATVTYDTRETNVPAMHEALLRSGYKPTRRVGGQ